MRLSEAMKLGSMLRPQAFGNIQHAGGTCALGAAFEAGGLVMVPDLSFGAALPTRAGSHGSAFTFSVPWDWFEIMALLVPCPGGCVCRLASTRTISAQIPHLNDFHKWPRERIASWIATIEAQQVSAVSEQGLSAQHAALPANGSMTSADAGTGGAICNASSEPESNLRRDIRRLLLDQGWHEEPYLESTAWVSDKNGYWHVSMIDQPERFALCREEEHAYLITEDIGTTVSELVWALRDRGLMDAEPEGCLDLLELAKAGCE